VRKKNLRERLGNKATPMAGETSAEVTEESKLSFLAGYTVRHAGSLP
jgi:hypothetical protein